jgi:hypothetical protein
LKTIFRPKRSHPVAIFAQKASFSADFAGGLPNHRRMRFDILRKNDTYPKVHFPLSAVSRGAA